MKKVKNGKIRIKDLIPNYGSKKFISIESGKAIVNEEKIEESSRWDGLHGCLSQIRIKIPRICFPVTGNFGA